MVRNFVSHSDRCKGLLNTHTHTHTHIYIYIYIIESSGPHGILIISFPRSLSSIALGASSMLYLVSAHSRCKNFLSGWPILARLCIGDKRKLLMISLFFLLPSPARLCRLCDVLNDGRLVALQFDFFRDVSSRICSREHTMFLCTFHLAFSFCILLTSMWSIDIVEWTCKHTHTHTHTQIYK